MRIQRASLRGALVGAVAMAAAVLPFSTASLAGPLSPPQTPGGVSVASGNKLLAVSWTESSSGTIAFTATARAPGRVTKSCRTKLLGCTISALANGVIYDVTVVASNRSGASAPSGAVSAAVGVPGPPLSVRATPATAAAVIAWAAPKTTGGSKVLAYVATASPGGFLCMTSSTLISGAARTCEIAGLTTGTTYSVTVAATNANGSGAPSRATSVTAG